METSDRQERHIRMEVARGKESADTVLLGGTIVNVHTLETYPADIAIKNGRIAYVGDVAHTIGRETRRIDVRGRYLTPGLIDCHMHVGGSQLSMTEFGKLALVHGATTIATDMYEIGIITGVKGIRFLLDELKATGLKPLFLVPMPAYHQNEAFENLGTFTLEDALEVLHWPDCLGINELNLSKIVDGDPGVERLVEEAQQLGKVLVGHAAALRGRNLQVALNAIGLTGDHECTSWEEANEKARLGLSIQIRDGSVGSDIRAVVGAAPQQLNTIGDFAYSTDEVAPDRMDTLGHADAKVRLSVAAGAPPVLAIRGATLNAARFFRLDHEIGSLTPGKWADILVVDDLRSFRVRTVFVDGEAVVQEGGYARSISAPAYPAFLADTMHLSRLAPDTFAIRVPEGATGAPLRVRVIKARDGSLFSEWTEAEVTPRGGLIEADPGRDLLKVALLDRHQRSGRKGVGFITGFGLKEGAIASTFNPCSENLAVMGTNDRDMLAAANHLIETKGGFAVARNGRIVKALALPIGGIMADAPYAEVVRLLGEVHQAIASMGCVIANPFHILAFMVFPAHFGALKICTYGLVDVEKAETVDLIVRE